MSIKAGATSQTINILVTDTSGDPLTGLVHNTAGLTCYYVRPGAAPVAVALATLAANNSAWSSGGFKEVDSANCPGLYRLDVPNAAIAASAPHVVIYLRGATSMAPAILKVDLVAYDPQSATNLGLTDVTAIKAKTDNLPGSPAAVGSAMTLATNSVTAAALASDAVAEITAAAATQVITRSGAHTLTALDTGIDGTVGLFVGDRYGLTVRALVGNEPPGGTGAAWTASTTDEATGTAITTDASLTEISEELGYFAYSLAAGDTVSARRVRLTVKHVVGGDVRIFGPLVLNVRDR